MRKRYWKNSFLIVVSVLLLKFGAKFIAAEDERDDDEYEYVAPDQSEDDEEAISQSSKSQSPKSSGSDVSKTNTKTVVDPNNSLVTTEITQHTESVIKPDRDGDGMIDEQDPHPDIAEIYIVADENVNGIVDSFEQFVNQ